MKWDVLLKFCHLNIQSGSVISQMTYGDRMKYFWKSLNYLNKFNCDNIKRNYYWNRITKLQSISSSKSKLWYLIAFPLLSINKQKYIFCLEDSPENKSTSSKCTVIISSLCF